MPEGAIAVLAIVGAAMLGGEISGWSAPLARLLVRAALRLAPPHERTALQEAWMGRVEPHANRPFSVLIAAIAILIWKPGLDRPGSQTPSLRLAWRSLSRLPARTVAAVPALVISAAFLGAVIGVLVGGIIVLRAVLGLIPGSPLDRAWYYQLLYVAVWIIGLGLVFGLATSILDFVDDDQDAGEGE